MPSIPVIGLKGLKTSGNPLTFPSGSMKYATNCVLSSAAEVQPRVGQPRGPTFGVAGDMAYELTTYEGRVVVHQGPSSPPFAADALEMSDAVGYDQNTTFTPLAGAWARAASNMRMKFAQLADNLYWASSSGVGVLDGVSGSARLAGVAGPPVTNATLTGNPGSGWFVAGSCVAYRCVFGRKDLNNNVKLSAPSGQVVLINPADVTASLARVGSTVTATVTSHNFKVGDIFALSPGSVDFLAGNYTVTAVTGTTIQYTNLGTGAAGPLAAQTLSSGSKNASVTAIVPDGVGLVAGDFVQVYRTITAAQSPTGAYEPGDECALAYERTLSTTDISNRSVTITDTSPDGFLGSWLYTNDNSGEGIAYAHYPPPLMKDVCVFDGRLFGAQTTGPHELTIRLIGVDSTSTGLRAGDLVALGKKVYVMTPYITDIYQPLENIDATANAFCVALSQAASGEFVATPTATDTLPVGGIFVQRRALTDGVFYAATSRASAFQDYLPGVTAVTEASSSRTGSTVTITTATSHGFATGNYVTLAYEDGTSEDANFTAGVKGPITVTGGTTFTYDEAGSATTMSGAYYVYFARQGASTTGALGFESKQLKKQVRFSQPGEPEAWPILNALGGLPERAVLRIKSLRGALYVFFEDGDIFSVTGQAPYTVQKFNGSAALLAPDSLVEHAESLFCLTTQGVTAINESGVRPLSNDVERPLIDSAVRYNDATNVFGVSYQSNRQYQLWLIVTPTDSPLETFWVANGAYVFHSDSGQFTEWTGFRTCGLVVPGESFDFKAIYGTSEGNWLRAEQFPAADGRDYIDDEVTIQSLGMIEEAAIGVPNALGIYYTGDLEEYLDGVDAIKVGSAQYAVLGISNVAGSVWAIQLDSTPPGLNFVGFFTPDSGAMDRTSNVVSVLLDGTGFLTGALAGDAFQVGAVSSADANFAVGAQLINTIDTASSFTYLQVGSNATCLQPYWFSRSYTEVTARWAVKPLKVGWLAQSGGAPGIEKQWREVQIHFGQQAIDSFELEVSGERDAATQTSTVDVGTLTATLDAGAEKLTTIRAGIPVDSMRQAMVEISLSFSETPGQHFRILGNTLTTETSTERTPR